ncbi:MAG: methyltransferase domain-containing protein [Candidatus Micrarchaeaceae archaeon]
MTSYTQNQNKFQKHSTFKIFDNKLRKAFRFKQSKDLPDSFNSENCYHTNPMTYFYRTKREFEGVNLNINKTDKLLDWGCSTGVSTLAIANYFQTNNVIGLDISETRVRIAINKNIPSANNGYVIVYNNSIGSLVKEQIPEKLIIPNFFLISDGFYPPFKDGTFKAVFCMNNIYYILNKSKPNDLSLKIKGITRLVSNEGYLIISGTDNLINNEMIILKNKSGNFSPIYSTFVLNNFESRIKLEKLLKNVNRN